MGDELRLPRGWIDDHCPGGKGVEIACEEDPISSSDKPATASVSLGGDTSVEFRGQHGTVGVGCKGDGIPIGLVVGPPAKSTWAVTGRQSYCVIEKEQRSPGSRGIEWMFPTPELGVASNPKRPVVMTYQLAAVINQTATVPCEQPA